MSEAAADDQQTDRRRKVPIRTKLLFASGGLQEATVTGAGIATILFYNQVLGVSPLLAGTAYLIVSIVDAISDPTIGTLSDRFRSRWGRRHPFMLASALPIAISFYFLYQPMEGLSETGYFIWLTVFFLFLRLGQTFYLIPHDALGAELTDDYHERSSIFGYNLVAQMILSMVMVAIILYIIFPTTPEFENGLLNEARYSVLAIVGSVTIVFSVLMCTFGTMDQIPFLHDLEASKKFSLGEYFRELSVLLRNRSYLAACLSMVITFISLGILGVVTTYAYIYVFELSSEQMFWATVAKMPGVIVALPLLAWMSKRLDKKQIVIRIILTTSILVAIPHTLKLLGLFVANDSPFLIPALFGPLLIGFMVFPVSQIILDSQLCDVADEHELQTGSRAEGIIFSVRSFGNKATQGIGGFIAGFGLTFIGFPDNAAEVGLEPETITGLLVLNGPVYLVFYLLAAFCMTFYNIDEERHNEILKALAERREAAAGDGA